MSILNNDKFFFFDEKCSNLKIVPGSIEHGYLAVLNEDLVSAEKIFSDVSSARANWGCIFVSILTGIMKEFPTYFQIRNFWEIDLDLLIKNQKIPYVEQLLGAQTVLSAVNQEIYKYTARVMYENKLYSAALKYMNEAKNVYYNDAELHFLLAKYYLRVNDYKESLFYINECLKLVPDYYPAIVFKQKIEEIDY